MGRRSSHTPEELRQLIVDAAREVIETGGLGGYSAREIARKIGYSPGTIYNVFQDLDDVLLTLQIELLDQATKHMEKTAAGLDPKTALSMLAKSYVSFALENNRLWNLLFHHQPAGDDRAGKLHDGINAIISVITDAVMPLMPTKSRGEADIAARTLWAGVHGITAIAVTEKAPTLTPETAQAYADRLTQIYIKGLGRP